MASRSHRRLRKCSSLPPLSPQLHFVQPGSEDLNWLETSLCSEDSFSSGCDAPYLSLSSPFTCRRNHHDHHQRTRSHHRPSPSSNKFYTFPSPRVSYPLSPHHHHHSRLSRRSSMITASSYRPPRSKSPPRSVDSPRAKPLVDYITEELPELNILRFCLPALFPSRSSSPTATKTKSKNPHHSSTSLIPITSTPSSSSISSPATSPTISHSPSKTSISVPKLSKSPLPPVVEIENQIHNNTTMDTTQTNQSSNKNTSLIATKFHNDDDDDMYFTRSLLIERICILFWGFYVRLIGHGNCYDNFHCSVETTTTTTTHLDNVDDDDDDDVWLPPSMADGLKVDTQEINLLSMNEKIMMKGEEKLDGYINEKKDVTLIASPMSDADCETS